ncbi:TPA: TonB-dependent receptor [Pasteurella multocida]|nr:TonB-dependent receptor [Pasteurella multocida]
MQKTFLYSVITLVCASSYAHVFQLGQIEVIADNSSDLTTTRLEYQALEKNNITNVAKVAKITPGVSFERIGARSEQNINVRGFDARRVPIYIDGIPVYVPYDGNMDLGRFSTFDLSRIDISKGASAVLYGPNTMGGAINLISRKPTKPLEGTLGYGFQKGRDAKTSTNQTYFSLGSKQEQFYAQINGSFVERQGLQLSHHYKQQGKSLEDGGRAEQSVHRDKKLSLKLAYTPNNTDEYAFVLSTQKAKKEQPFYAGEHQSAGRFWRWNAWDKDSLYFLSHTQFAPHNAYINSKVFYDTFKNDLDMFKDATFTTADTSYYRDYSYGAGIELGADLTTQHTLKLALNYKADIHREHDNNDPVTKNKDQTYSIRLEHTYQLASNTQLISGISYDYRQANRAEKFDVKSKGKNAPKSINPFKLGNQHALNYQIKLSHRFDKNDEFAASFAKKTHLPTMKERYSRRFGSVEPNPFLGPETAYHYEVSYLRTFNDWLRLEGALFYSDVHDAIEEVVIPNHPDNLKQNQNYGKEIRKGIELAATAFVTDNLTLGANYTYLRAKNRTHKEMIIHHIPRHKVFVYADWKVLPNLSLYVSQEAETGRYSLDRIPNRQIKANTTKVAGFGVTNTKLTYQATSNFVIDAGINNIFDKNYYYTYGMPEEGRVYFANVKYMF